MAMQVNSSVGGISKNPCPKKLNHFADDLEKVIGAGQGRLRPSLCIAHSLICFLVVQTNLFSVSWRTGTTTWALDAGIRSLR